MNDEKKKLIISIIIILVITIIGTIASIQIRKESFREARNRLPFRYDQESNNENIVLSKQAVILAKNDIFIF